MTTLKLPSYEELYKLEKEFDAVDDEIIRQQYKLSKPLWERRAQLFARIPQAWGLIFEQAPETVDQHVQNEDSQVLFGHLEALRVTRPALDANPAAKDARSFAIEMDFTENPWFTDKTLRKEFIYREVPLGELATAEGADKPAEGDNVAARHPRVVAGHISEPVTIQWKPGKDLTHGLLDLARKVWDEQGATSGSGGDKGRRRTTRWDGKVSAAEKQLRDKLEHTTVGDVSFFALFGYIGRPNYAWWANVEEGAVARRKEEEARRKGERATAARERAQTQRRGGGGGGSGGDNEDFEDDDDDDEDDDDDVDMDDDEWDDLEIFPSGGDLALEIAEELWPTALVLLTQALQRDDEDDDNEGEEYGPGKAGAAGGPDDRANDEDLGGKHGEDEEIDEGDEEGDEEEDDEDVAELPLMNRWAKKPRLR